MNHLKRLYRWVLHWADTPYGSPALFLLAFSEASFFPVPPDVLLIMLCISRPKRALFYALLCTAGSVIGGIFGFYIGLNFWHIAKQILFHYIDYQTFENVRMYFLKYEAWAVAAAGFTPIPYKVFTISAGFFRVNFPVFIVASLLSRGARFFLVSTLIYFFGESIRDFIDRYFNILTIVFMVLLIGGFLVVRYLVR
ncbi:MAG: DedA family protein [Nitrospirae bacterium]|nr:MAG: DedA family protein [Nitrospirota bacterium]